MGIYIGGMALKFKRVLVTGGAGFIGSHLVDALVAQGCRVGVLDNLSTGNLANLAQVSDHIEFHTGDIRDLPLLLELSTGCDVIFHLAAEVSVPRTVENPVVSAMINEMGTLHVLEAARQNGVPRVVFSSSCAVYGNGADGPKRETMTPDPLSPYAIQKLAGEYYARLYHDLYGVGAVCLRYFNVYGPRQDPSSPYSGVISIFMTRAVSAKQPIIYGDGGQYRDFVFVKDVVTANLLAAATGGAAGSIFNVGTGSFVTVDRMWQDLCRMTGIAIRPEYAPQRPGDILKSVAEINHIQAELGFKPEYTFEKGLSITLDWYKNM